MARAVLDHLVEHAALGPDIGPGDFSALLVTELQAKAVRDDVEAHHCLRIHGPREARLHGHGTVILSGLNEGGWPQALSPDPWLSRQMRAAAGLPLPERQIGLAAHDFQQAVAADRVYLTRAKRDAEAETIPSRWLNRMLNLMGGLPDRGGPEALARMRARGAEWLALAQAVARPPRPGAPGGAPLAHPAAAPVPGPAGDGRVAADPRPLCGLCQARAGPARAAAAAPAARRVAARPDPACHRRGAAAQPSHPRHPARGSQDRFLALTDRVLADEVPWPAARAFWSARIARIADRIVADELTRLAEGRPMVVEHRGKVPVADLGITLTAKPDRIDLLTDNRVVVYDYKSGTPPTDAMIRHFDKQLMLEAAMARRGGFDALGPVDVAGLRYIQLGGEGKTHPREHDDLIEAETWDGFVRLLRSYVTGEAGSPRCVRPKARPMRAITITWRGTANGR